MYKNDILCCDICGEPIKTSDRECTAFTLRKVNALPVEDYHKIICGDCMYNAELYEVWRYEPNKLPD